MHIKYRIVLSCAALCLALSPYHPDFQAYGQQGSVAATPQRPTFTANTSTTAPGTIELESGATAADGAWTVPTTLKFAPDVSGGLFHRLALSVAAELIDSQVPETSRR